MKKTNSHFFLLSRLMVASLFLGFALTTNAQTPLNLPLQTDFTLDAEAKMASLSDTNLTSVRPFRHYQPHSLRNPDDTKQSWFKRKLFNESLYSIRSSGFVSMIDPLFNFSIGQSSFGSNLFSSYRGARIMGMVGDKVGFETRVYLAEERVPAYMDSLGRVNNSLPGRFVFGNTGSVYQMAIATGYFSYSPSKNYNLQIGYDRLFIGEGFRSLLLSDYAPPFPYFKITTEAGPIRYTNLYTQMIDNRSPRISRVIGKPIKYTVIHQLDIRLTKRIQWGFFQSLVTAARDTAGNYRGFDFQYLNPVIFLSPIEFSIGSPDNTLLGTTLKYKLSSTTQLYGQLLFDEMRFAELLKQRGWWANKYSVQLGVKTYRFAGVENLFARLEGNVVRPYTYSHWGPDQSYVHNNLPLAHPLGSNFAEVMTQWRYSNSKWRLNAQLNYAITGSDTGGLNFGNEPDKDHNRYVSEFGNEIGQGLQHQWWFAEIRAAYVINPSTNMRVELSLTHRGMTNRPNQQGETWVMFTFATRIENFYQDF